MALSKPSSPDPVYTPGTTRGAKLAALLVDEGTALLRKVFEHEIQNMNPPSLRQQLWNYKGYLCGLRHFNPGQKKTLYPPSGKTSSVLYSNVPDTAQGFDISLLEILLKELCQNPPYSGERDRLRRFRNDNYGHRPTTDLSEPDFNRLWKELTDILVDLGGDGNTISERLNPSIDPEKEAKHWRNCTDLLEKLHNEDVELKGHILAQGESLQKGQEKLSAQGESLQKGQEKLSAQGDSLEKGQEKLSAQGESLQKGQEKLSAQGESLEKGQEKLSAQGESLQKGQEKLSAQGESLQKGQEKLNQGQDRLESLLMEPPWLQQVRDNQSADSSHNAEPTPGPCEAADDVIDCLKILYTTEYENVRPLPWFEDLDLKRHLGEVYTKLKLQCSDGRGNFQDVDTSAIVSLADIYATREGEASQASVRSSVRKIRVEGDPGIGKSCSCQKLAYDWSCGKLDRFKVVFLLEMRHLAGGQRDEIFEQLLPKDLNTKPDQLWSYIQENQDDVLFILDGLDELSQAARIVTDTVTGKSQSSDVVDLLQGKILRNCHVLVTSRPYHCGEDLNKCHQFYRIVGYTKENSEEFIRKYFCESPESASKLVQQLHRNMNLSQIIVNPLCNLLICVLWEYNNKELPSSKAELYQDIVDSVAKRFCKKRDPDMEVEGDQLPPDLEEALQCLGKLSWEGLEQEQVQFKIDEIKKKYGTTANGMLNMGLLTRDYSIIKLTEVRYCAFLHKTFQEYMAARYISGLVMDGSSREEGMKCVCRIFGMSDANVTVVKIGLAFSRRRKYREMQNWLLLILGENSRPLFERFAVELSKCQTDEKRELLSFLCIMWLGTTCAGGKMAKIVAPCLSQHATNEMGYVLLTFAVAGEQCDMVETGVDISDRMSRLGTLNQMSKDDHKDWCVGLAHVLAFQKKLSSNNSASVIQHLTINCDIVTQEDKVGVLQNALLDYGRLRSVTIRDICFDTPLLIPRCGTERVVIYNNPYRSIDNLKILNMLEQLSTISTIQYVEITAFLVSSDYRDVDFSEYDRQLACMIKSHSRLRSLKFEIGCWKRSDSKTRGFGNLTGTLQSISEHARLEVTEIELPCNDGFGEDVNNVTFNHETFNVEPMVHELTECLKKNKVLKRLRLRWRISTSLFITSNINIYYLDCSSQSLSSLCSAIRENRTLETLVVDGMISHSECGAEMISELIRNKPKNYKELSITLSDSTSVHDQLQDKLIRYGVS